MPSNNEQIDHLKRVPKIILGMWVEREEYIDLYKLLAGVKFLIDTPEATRKYAEKYEIEKRQKDAPK